VSTKITLVAGALDHQRICLIERDENITSYSMRNETK